MYQLCVPLKQVVSLVTQQHSDMGHFGYKKTYLKMKCEFYWPKMQRHIRKIVTWCVLCQKTKVSKKCLGNLNPIIARKPGDLVSLDLMGPLPKSKGGVTQLLVVVDCFSRYVRLHPLKKATAQAILNKLKTDYFSKVGVSQAILSDNGTQFRSTLWRWELSGYNIKVKHTSGYFPQGNPTERANREIGRLLRAFCSVILHGLKKLKKLRSVLIV